MESDDPNAPVAASVWVPEQVRGAGDAAVAWIAERQKGFVHREQLFAARIGRGAITHRIKHRRLHAYYRDVYLVGRPRPEPLGPAMAAVLHFRGHAIVSHRTAGEMWGLLEPGNGVPTLTVVGRDARPRRGLELHRVKAISPDELRRRHGLPITSAARVLVELAGALTELELENALAECRSRRLATDSQIERAIAGAANYRGIRALRELLAGGTPSLTRSAGERLLLRMIRDARMPAPVANAPVCGFTVDLLWLERRLIVEFDGWGTHRDRASFERDRLRDQRLVAAGYRVIRITWRQLEREPYAVLARLAAALGSLAWS
ncbi:MAG: endonuclease domain-containing protein [Solirubrobacteraceae bacterium]